MAEQLGLDLPARAALGRDDFFVSNANAMALALVESWPNWAANKLAIIGPEGSGKTHLASVWAAQSGARIIEATALSKDIVPDLAQTPVSLAPPLADLLSAYSPARTSKPCSSTKRPLPSTPTGVLIIRREAGIYASPALSLSTQAL